ncbi:hypothetical protein PR048_022598 [Dryococelus australis]|uniref:Uncharacterized protein n=1 Tax=Dryococelus australis TaxID=614101 RepID=A0ABQ9H1F5_9NEOP|nr:hypothetical protein PR048_022598 [Dryococelus australis]
MIQTPTLTTAESHKHARAKAILSSGSLLRDYNKAINCLNSEPIAFHAHAHPDERNIKAIIEGVDRHTLEYDIVDELQKAGNHVQDQKQMIEDSNHKEVLLTEYVKELSAQVNEGVTPVLKVTWRYGVLVVTINPSGIFLTIVGIASLACQYNAGCQAPANLSWCALLCVVKFISECNCDSSCLVNSCAWLVMAFKENGESRIGRISTSKTGEPMRVKLVEYGAAPECRGERNVDSPFIICKVPAIGRYKLLSDVGSDGDLMEAKKSRLHISAVERKMEMIHYRIDDAWMNIRRTRVREPTSRGGATIQPRNMGSSGQGKPRKERLHDQRSYA